MARGRKTAGACGCLGCILTAWRAQRDLNEVQALFLSSMLAHEPKLYVALLLFVLYLPVLSPVHMYDPFLAISHSMQGCGVECCQCEVSWPWTYPPGPGFIIDG